MTRYLIIATALFSFSSAAVAAEGKQLSGDEIKALFTGQTLQGTGSASSLEQIYGADGKTSFKSDVAQGSGEWKIENNKQCESWATPVSWYCYDVFLDGELITKVSPEGGHFRAVVKK